MFTLAISCLTMSHLPWFMGLTFQDLMQYCSLQHQILPSSSDTSTTERHFGFGPSASFFLEVFLIVLHSFPVVYWTPSYLGGAHLLVPYLFAFSYCSWASYDKILEWFAIPSSSGPHFVRTLHYGLSILGGPALHGSESHWVTQGPLPWQGCDPWSCPMTQQFHS